jgi:hypothetical protein
MASLAATVIFLISAIVGTYTDALLAVTFWITFVLAQMGVEHKSNHVGLFHTLSVLRTVRLLAILSGTTVSDADP